MIVSISQPAYLPWLGYFDRISRSDLVVVLDNVQFERRGYTHRNKIRKKERPIWLTVPVNKKGNYHAAINQIKIADDFKWQKKHWDSISQAYSKSAFFSYFSETIKPIYENKWLHLIDLLQESTNLLLNLLGVEKELVYSSDINLPGTKSGLILNTCLELGADQYISGPFGRDYLNRELFEQNGLQILFHDYTYPSYTQAYPGFEPFMSTIDLLFNHGPASMQILREGGSLNDV